MGKAKRAHRSTGCELASMGTLRFAHPTGNSFTVSGAWEREVKLNLQAFSPLGPSGREAAFTAVGPRKGGCRQSAHIQFSFLPFLHPHDCRKADCSAFFPQIKRIVHLSVEILVIRGGTFCPQITQITQIE